MTSCAVACLEGSCRGFDTAAVCSDSLNILQLFFRLFFGLQLKDVWYFLQRIEERVSAWLLSYSCFNRRERALVLLVGLRWYYCSSLWPFCCLRKLKTHLTYTQMIYDVHFDDQINCCWTALLVAQQGTPAFAGADRFHLRVVKILRGFKNKVTTVLQYLFCFLRTKTCRSHTQASFTIQKKKKKEGKVRKCP